MSEFIKTKLGIVHEFDTKTKRHYLNGIQSVYHCHHYSSLYTQLAIDAGETKLLADTSEENFYEVLTTYFIKKHITNLDNRIDIACQYYSAMGLGLIEVQFLGEFSGKVISTKSHLEEGWIKKWKIYDKPVNYVGCGYVSALFAAVQNMLKGSYTTFEVESIVKGDEKTVFKSYKK
ncbi:MAG: hypothetical protein MI922_16510 [Bacteroidales bacterium]|nr:hypothetical protein [Bacteroidales bacterium]